MSDPRDYHGELASSIEALFEGTLSADEAERVARAVTEDPAAAELYWDYVELHTELRRIHHGTAASAAGGSVAPALGETPAPGAPLADASDPPSPPTVVGGMGSGLGMLLLGLGGVLCIGAVAALVAWFGLGGSPGGPDRPGAIARVTSMSNCAWADAGDDGRYAIGSPLTAGDCVRIRSGSVQLTYGSGVAVTLTGPASYRVVDEKYGALMDGSALARVPKQAIGFTIDTDAGTFIDCGTEFKVKVAKDEETGVVTADMDVIEGAVEIDAPSPAGTETKRKRFTAGEAMRVSSLNSASHAPKTNEAFDPRTVPGLRLWLNADAGVLRGPDDRVTEVIDLVGDSNASAENARQPSAENRPRWLSETANRRPTLIFEGKQYVQLPSQSDLNFEGESLSIFVVGNASGGTQYFLSSRTDGENHNPRGYRFTTSLDGNLRYQAAGVTVVQPCDTRQRAAFSVVHDRRTPGANTVAMFRNGRQLGPEVRVRDANISNAFPLTIGANPESIRKYPAASRNYLRGELGEVLIYDRVLTPEQRGQVETYLIRKYGFAPSADAVSGVVSGLPENRPVAGGAHTVN